MSADVKGLKRKLKIFSRSLLMNSILVFPRMRISKQDSDEKVVLVVRKHPVILLWKMILALAELLFGFLIIYLLTSGTLGIFNNMPKGVTIVLILINLMIFISTIWVGYLTWYYDLVIATTKRVVDMDFANILNMRWSEARLNKIEDVTVGASGFLSALFDMGNLFLQTAGSKDEFEIRNVPKPLKVQSIIMELANTSRRR